MKRSHLFVSGLGLVALLAGCSSSTSGPPTGLKSGAFKKGGYARLLNASTQSVGLSVGSLTLANDRPSGEGTPFMLVPRGKKDITLLADGKEAYKQPYEVESEKTLTVVAYSAGGKLEVKILPDLPRYGESAGAMVQVANFAGPGITAQGSGGVDLGSNLAMAALGPAVKAGSGSFSVDVMKGGKKVTSVGQDLQDGQAYTVLIMPGPQPGSIRAAIHQNTVKMEAAIGGITPN